MSLPWFDVDDEGDKGHPSAQRINENFRAILSGLVTGGTIDTGNRGLTLRYGMEPVTFTASATSALLTITHRLGTTPIVVVGLEAIQNNRVLFATRNYTATTFDVDGYCVPGAITGPVNFAWIAIG